MTNQIGPIGWEPCPTCRRNSGKRKCSIPLRGEVFTAITGEQYIKHSCYQEDGRKIRGKKPKPEKAGRQLAFMGREE